jgi:hypothetical protein
MDQSLRVALKEWDILCRALAAGDQVLLLRKGGISESIGGFEIEHRQFVFFPTFLHQQASMLKPAWRERLVMREVEPDDIEIASAGEITDIVRVRDRAQMDRLGDLHIWAPPLIDMRFNYKPKNPLYLLVVRTYRLPRPVTIRNTPEYAGCRSWVPLTETIDVSDAEPALDDRAFESRRQEILTRLG